MSVMPLFICWITWATAFMREALVMDFIMALYQLGVSS
jgi:hypothetical protein